MRVRDNRTMTREVLARCFHTGIMHAGKVCPAKPGNDSRVIRQGAITDHGTATIQVKNRRKAEINSAGQHFCCHHAAVAIGHIQRFLGV